MGSLVVPGAVVVEHCSSRNEYQVKELSRNLILVKFFFHYFRIITLSLDYCICCKPLLCNLLNINMFLAIAFLIHTFPDERNTGYHIKKRPCLHNVTLRYNCYTAILCKYNSVLIFCNGQLGALIKIHFSVVII